MAAKTQRRGLIIAGDSSSKILTIDHQGIVHVHSNKTFNKLGRFIKYTHRKSFEIYPHFIFMDDHEKFRMNGMGVNSHQISSIYKELIKSSEYFYQRNGIIEPWEHGKRYDQLLHESIRDILKEEVQWLNDNKVKACYGIHAELKHEWDGMEIKLAIKIFPVLYFEDPDDQLLFKLSF